MFNIGPSANVLKKMMPNQMGPSSNQMGSPMTQMPHQMGGPNMPPMGMMNPQGPIDVGMNIGNMPRQMMGQPNPIMRPPEMGMIHSGSPEMGMITSKPNLPIGSGPLSCTTSKPNIKPRNRIY